MEKHEFGSVSLTVRDRAISSKFFQTTVYLGNVLLAIFKKNFLSPEMAAILNFRIFAKNEKKTKICFYPLNCVR